MRSLPNIFCLAAVVVILQIAMTYGYRGREKYRPNPRSCREANLCCPGQNNTCFVFGTRVDRSQDSKRCYCDSNCLIMGDCCMDYHHHCKSEYSPFVLFQSRSLVLFTLCFNFRFVSLNNPPVQGT
ncbi:somatomedin-b and thrombospondin type-1 domain-containing protein [Plakobranchus ocellatus]|uniref:Somatomedin-b and thrombospondin type-1 domain-containing protein n=1 Tax=Plakobranchus ocellatus TaxID=259542 RepID=A0AAV3ZYH4_9GAST|nr:somatomedin-b and thrombospondin type-1 domain-containing protein [Plakobranchus ocellatus]